MGRSLDVGLFSLIMRVLTVWLVIVRTGKWSHEDVDVCDQRAWTNDRRGVCVRAAARSKGQGARRT